MSKSLSAKVFISYRRQDSAWPTRQIYEALVQNSPAGHVFMDTDSIPPGEEFIAYMDERLSKCNVLLAVIGPHWLSVTDHQTGERRIDKPFDYVRVEIRTALERRIPVVPVLLDGVTMPTPEDLPEDIRALSGRQALELHLRSVEADLDKLVRSVARLDHRPPSVPVPEMVRIAPGEFMMGSAPDEPGALGSEQPQHLVVFARPFEMGKYAVTFEEYDAFCEATRRGKPSDKSWGGGRRPAINIGFDDAVAYCEWLNDVAGPGWRLPSEAEWEYCCRAGTTGPFNFRGPIDTDVVNYRATYVFDGSKPGRYRRQTINVGDLPANKWGLHEMHGNVWEWCADRWNPTFIGAPDDGTAWMTGDSSLAVMRGGSWLNAPAGVRAAVRIRHARTVRDGTTGFRIARTRPDLV